MGTSGRQSSGAGENDPSSSAFSRIGEGLSKHPVVEYMSGVLDGSIPAGKWIRLAVQRHLNDLESGEERGIWFDRSAAQHVIDYFGFLKHSKGEWSGEPFILLPWQQFLLWVLFGWKRRDGFRRFRTAYVEVPRKNGKSTLAAGIGLYLLTGDGEPGAEVYSAATKRDQAKITWNEAVQMVRRSPALSRMIRHYRSGDNLSVEATASKFMPLGQDSDTMDGLNVHGAIIDELHAHKDRGVVSILETATGARRQPLIFEITTAGSDQDTVCWDHHFYSTQILEGIIEADTWFTFIASIDEGDDWKDPVTWAKANPSLGVSVKLDDLQRKADKAEQLPADQNSFRRLHLNEWTQQTTRWIDVALWDANSGGKEIPDLSGREFYAGLDLSSVSDITAWVMVFPGENPEDLEIRCRFWCPKSRLSDPTNRYRDQYQVWANQGYLEVTPGEAVEYKFAKKRILEDAAKYKLVDVNVDRLFQGYSLSQELEDEGLKIFGMGQGFLGMAVPMREFERRLLEHRLRHHGNPVLRFMAAGVAVRKDPSDNMKVDKAASQCKVDGIVALVMAIDRAMRHGQKKKSVYEERGLEVA